MRSTMIITALVLIACPAEIDSGEPQTTATMKISGMSGQFVVLADHIDWSQIEGLPDPTAPRTGQSTNPLTSRGSGALASRGGALGGGSGRVAVQDISFVKEIDKASPKIADACMKGEVFPKAEIEFVSPGGSTQEYLCITLKNVVITNFQMNSGGDRPSENITLTYSEVSWEYKPIEQIQRATPSFYSSTPISP